LQIFREPDGLISFAVLDNLQDEIFLILLLMDKISIEIERDLESTCGRTIKFN
jgi:hypothetical protein